jgi:MFS family permease
LRQYDACWAIRPLSKEIPSRQSRSLAAVYDDAVVVVACGMPWWSWHVDRTGKKIGNLVIACVIGMLGLAASVVSGNLLIALAALTVAGLALWQKIHGTEPRGSARACRARRMMRLQTIAASGPLLQVGTSSRKCVPG